MSDERDDYLNLTGTAGDHVPVPPPAPDRPRRTSGADRSRWRGSLIGAGVCAVALVAVAGVRFAAAGDRHHPAAAASSSLVQETQPASPLGSNQGSDQGSDQGTTSAPAEPTRPFTTSPVAPAKTRNDRAVRTAEKCVRELVNTSRSQEQWQQAVGAFGTAGMVQSLASTDKGAIPAQHVTGAGRVLTASTEEPVVTVFVPTSGHGYTVNLLSNDGGHGWLVDTVTPGKPASSTPTDAE